MDFVRQIAKLRSEDLERAATTLAFAPWAVGWFLWETATHFISEWREWKYGKVTKVRNPWLPNGQQH